VQEFTQPKAELERDLTGLPGITYEPRANVLLIAIDEDRQGFP
jgi:hypothetical protein